jgi:putative addiction module antidote
MNKQSKINKPLKIIKVGNSAGVILPKHVLARLRVAEGDIVDVVDNGDDGLELRRHDEDSEFNSQMAAAREVMERRKRALRELAK